MAINTALLIAAPMLQDYLVDNVTGLPLTNGTISLFQDNSRTTYKRWYYQSGSPGAYTYIPLPNPLTLSAVGTITDPNGNDTIPFYYPYSETDNVTPQSYYVVVVNSNGQQQFTRQNFPFNPSAGAAAAEISTLDNLIVNGEFWRNNGAINVSSPGPNIQINGVTFYYSTLAPSQHDGFIMSDIQFFKNNNNGTELVNFYTFVNGSFSFPDQIIPFDITPEYYLNFKCTAAGTESTKYIQFPIQLHVASLSGVKTCSVKIDAMSVSDNGEQITLEIFQFLGTGATSPAPIVIETISLTGSWDTYTVVFPMPSAQNLTLGAGADDALYLLVGLPAATICEINIAKPSLYLSEEIPTNDFHNYDSINSVISSPRVGDIRCSLNSYYVNGWIPMNDTTIGSGASGATGLASYQSWLLYATLYTNVSNTYAPVSGGRSGSTIQAAYNDFVANKTLALTKTLGRAISSVGTPSTGGTNWALGEIAGEETHTLTINEMPAHNHRLLGAQSAAGDSHTPTNLGDNNATPGLPDSDSLPITPTGGGVAHNTIQPTTYMNIFIKL